MTKHYIKKENYKFSLCGMFSFDEGLIGYYHNPFYRYVTTDENKVTCKRCLSRLIKIKNGTFKETKSDKYRKKRELELNKDGC